MRELSKEQIADLWAFEKSYTLCEVATLWLDELPHDPSRLKVKAKRPYLSVPGHKKTAARKRLKQLLEAVGNGVDGELEVAEFSPAIIYDDSYEEIGKNWDKVDPEKTTVCRTDLLRWAKTATSELPLFLAITETEAIRLNDVLNLVFDENILFTLED